MRLRLQLAIGGGLLALAVLVLAHLYADPASHAGDGNRLTDPMFVVLTLLVGGGAGLLMSAVLAPSLRLLTAIARQAESGRTDGPALDLPSRAPVEAVELRRALQDLAAHRADTVERLEGEIERLEVTLDSITEGILVTDREARILMANRALMGLFGLTHAVVGRRAMEAVRHAIVGDAIDSVLAGHGPVSCEIRIGNRHLDVQVAPIADADGLSGTVTVFYEITRLRRLERVREDFVANVSHELRTPLTAIKGCAETLVDGAIDDPAAARPFVSVIASHADRLTVLLNDLLDLARLESDQMSLEKGEVRVARLVDTAREAVAKVASDKGIVIDADVPADLKAVCDRKLIEQALINLVDNAVKYTGEGGRVRVSARAMTRQQAVVDLARRHWSDGSAASGGSDGEDRAVLIEVADTGIGIPSDEVERVFERFYRVDKGRSRAMGGTGLGLSIVRHAVELHRERVFVDTELGHGSRFGFTLAAAG